MRMASRHTALGTAGDLIRRLDPTLTVGAPDGNGRLEIRVPENHPLTQGSDDDAIEAARRAVPGLRVRRVPPHRVVDGEVFVLHFDRRTIAEYVSAEELSPIERRIWGAIGGMRRDAGVSGAALSAAYTETLRRLAEQVAEGGAAEPALRARSLMLGALVGIDTVAAESVRRIDVSGSSDFAGLQVIDTLRIAIEDGVDTPLLNAAERNLIQTYAPALAPVPVPEPELALEETGPAP